MTAVQIALGVLVWVNVIALIALVPVGAGFLALPALYLFQRRQTDAAVANSPPFEESTAPHVLVQLPVFNEANVVIRLLESVAALDWPADKLHIQLLDDGDDESVGLAEDMIARLRERGLRIDHMRRPDRSGFKAGALAAGLALSDAPFVAILDADFRPPASWLKAVIPRLMNDPTAGFIQSRFEFANAGDNWLTRAQGLLVDSHFIMEQGVRARAGMPIQFNGTGGVWRRAAIEAAGGWSSDSLAEDLNLAIRAALAGWRGVFIADPALVGLAPDRVEHWRVQQKRWSMGFAQNARSLAAEVWAADWPLAERLSAEFLLFYQAVLPALVIAVVAGLLDVAFGLPGAGIIIPLWIAAAVVVVALTVGMTLPGYLELRRGGLGRYFVTLASIPGLVVFLSFSNAAPVVTGFFGRKDVFHRTPKAARGI